MELAALTTNDHTTTLPSILGVLYQYNSNHVNAMESLDGTEEWQGIVSQGTGKVLNPLRTLCGIRPIAISAAPLTLSPPSADIHIQ